MYEFLDLENFSEFYKIKYYQFLLQNAVGI